MFETLAVWQTMTLRCAMRRPIFSRLEGLVERECAEAAACGLTDNEMTWLENARGAIALAKGGIA
jgi:hypothetical protein